MIDAALGGPDRRAVAGRTRACLATSVLRDDQRPRASPAPMPAWPGTCRTCGAHGSTGAPRRRPGSRPHRGGSPVRLVSDVLRPGPASGDWARAPVLLGDLVCWSRCGSGGSPPRSTASTPSRAWSGFFEAGRRCPQGPAHRPDGGARARPRGRRFTPASAGGRLRPVLPAPRSGPARPVTPSGRARWSAPSGT